MLYVRQWRLKTTLIIFVSMICNADSYRGTQQLQYNEYEQSWYTIRRGDILSEILQHRNCSPLWGNRGFVKKVALENSLRSEDKLKPGEKIKLPRSCDQYEVADSSEDQIKRLPSNTEIPQTNLEIKMQVSTASLAEPVKPSPVAFEPSVQNSSEVSAVSEVMISLGSGYSRVDSSYSANQADSILLSKPISEFNFGWQLNWSESFRSFVRYGLSTVQYRSAEIGNVINSNQQATVSSFGVSSYLQKADVRLEFESGIEERVYVPSFAQSTATADLAPVLFFKSTVMKPLFRKKTLMLDGGLGLSYLASSRGVGYDIKNGLEYSGYLQMKQNLKSFHLVTSLEYQESYQETSLTRQKTREVRTRFGIEIPLGEAE